MDLLQDQESRKSPSDHSTESFEQLESLVSREEELAATGNLLEVDSVPTTTAANLNLDLLTEETGEGLPLNMQLSMTTSDHSTPDAPKPNLVGEPPSNSATESAPNEPGGGDSIVPTSPPLPQVEEDDNFYQFESRYESKEKQEVALEEQKIVGKVELVQPSLIEEEDILERDIIKEECLTKSFMAEEDEEEIEKADDFSSSPVAFEVLQTKIEEEVKREIAEVQREVLFEDASANVKKIVEEPKVQSVQSSVVESPPVIPKLSSSSFEPEALLLEKKEDQQLDAVEPHLRSSPPLSSPTITAPSFSSKVEGPTIVPEQFERIPKIESVKPLKQTKSAMDEANPQDCPFKTIGSYFVRDNLNPQLADLVFWKDPKKSGIAFSIGLIILLSLACCSVISVVSYTALTILTGALGFRIYKSILQAVQKTNDGHPFKEYLELEVTLPNERVHQTVDIAVKHVNATILKLRSVFLAEDIIDSLKFVAIFWCLTYIGSWFNGLTLIILAYLGAFSLPKVYEMHQAQIDQVLEMVCKQVSDVMNMVKSKIPFPAPKDKKQ